MMNKMCKYHKLLLGKELIFCNNSKAKRKMPCGLEGTRPTSIQDYSTLLVLQRTRAIKGNQRLVILPYDSNHPFQYQKLVSEGLNFKFNFSFLYIYFAISTTHYYTISAFYCLHFTLYINLSPLNICNLPVENH